MARNEPGAGAAVEKDIDLLVIGEINADLILTGPDLVPAFGQVEKLVAGATLAVGGSAVITACGAARLGLRTAFVGVVGEDPIGRFMLGAMREAGIDTSGCATSHDSATGISVILAPTDGAQERAILTAPGAVATLTADHVDRSLLRRARHLHSGGYFLQPRLHAGLPALFAEARRLGASCSIDTNWDPSGAWDSNLAAVLAESDLFLPNREELLRATRSADLAEALASLAGLDATVAVKLGARGAGSQRGDTRHFAPAPLVSVRDAVGAGDSFDAGYLYGLLAGWDAARALAFAVACGALSTRAPGGTAGQPALPEALELAATIETTAWDVRPCAS